MSRKLLLLSTYPPDECGVASASWALRSAIIRQEPDARVDVVALRTGQHDIYPEEVVASPNPKQVSSIVLKHLAGLQPDAVLLQYERGLWDFNELLTLLASCRYPIVLIMQGLPGPLNEDWTHFKDAGIRNLMAFMAAHSSAIVAPIGPVKTILLNECQVPTFKIVTQPWPYNGPGSSPQVSRDTAKRRIGAEGRNVVLTYGLLSPRKGIEDAIDAIRQIRERIPDVLYCVLGAVHHRVEDKDGYLASLRDRIAQQSLTDHVDLRIGYAPYETLDLFLDAADCYLFPHRIDDTYEQISSGTLPHALFRNRPFVSVRTLCAESLAELGCGVTTTRSAEGIAAGLLDLLGNGERRRKVEQAASWAGRKMCWDAAVKDYISLIDRVCTPIAS